MNLPIWHHKCLPYFLELLINKKSRLFDRIKIEDYPFKECTLYTFKMASMTKFLIFTFCSHIETLCFLNLKRKILTYPGPGLEPGPLPFSANAQTNWAIQNTYRYKIELISWAIFSDLRTDILRLYYVLWRHAFSNSRMTLIEKIFSVTTT